MNNATTWSAHSPIATSYKDEMLLPIRMVKCLTRADMYVTHVANE